MNIPARGIAALKLLLVTLMLAFAGATLAQTPSPSLKERLVGHWQLVSITANTTTPPYGPDPQGSLFADAAGHYSVIVISSGGARNVSLFGTYTVNDSESSVTLHIAATNLADARGQDVKRFVAISDDELTVTTELDKGPVGPVKMVWKRAN